MLNFMVVGLPRSGTTWASNWLTTEGSLCLHDPLYHTHYTEWDSGQGRFERQGRQRLGVSCTGIWRWADWVNAHPARKVVLLRDVTEVQHSMSQIAMAGYIGEAESLALRRVEGLHVQHSDLFDPDGAEAIWHHLLPALPFDRRRHRELVDIEMQPKFVGLSVGEEVTRRLRDELSATSNGFF